MVPFARTRYQHLERIHCENCVSQSAHFFACSAFQLIRCLFVDVVVAVAAIDPSAGAVLHAGAARPFLCALASSDHLSRHGDHEHEHEHEK